MEELQVRVAFFILFVFQKKKSVKDLLTFCKSGGLWGMCS